MKTGLLKFIIQIIVFTIIIDCMTISALCAGTLKMNLSTRADAYVDRVEIGVIVKNLGTETARQAIFKLEFQDIEKNIKIVPKILPGHSVHKRFVIPITRQKTGSYPYIIKCLYYDSNDHLYSAVIASIFYVGSEKDVMPVDISVKKISILKHADFTCFIKNLSNKNLILSQNIAMPEGLEAKPVLHRFMLKGGSTVCQNISLTNNNLDPGGNYGIYYILETDFPDRHMASVMQARIHISELLNENWFYRTRRIWFRIFIFGFTIMSMGIIVILIFRRFSDISRLK